MRASIPLDAARLEAAKAELAGVSDDAVLYVAGMAALAAGLNTTPDPRSDLARQLAAHLSDALVNPDARVPDHLRLKARDFAEVLFSLLPPRTN
jgi:hypothetical protein